MLAGPALRCRPRLGGAHVPQLWQFVVLAIMVTLQHADSSLATGCAGLAKAGRVQRVQLFCDGSRGTACPRHDGVTRAALILPPCSLQAPHWFAGCAGGDKAGGAQKGNSFAAAAMAQAALNAMASTSSTDPLDTSPGALTPTTPAAAAVVVQVRSDHQLWMCG